MAMIKVHHCTWSTVPQNIDRLIKDITTKIVYTCSLHASDALMRYKYAYNGASSGSPHNVLHSLVSIAKLHKYIYTQWGAR